MDGNRPKEGVSVNEIGEFAKRHRYEVFFCLLFLLACIFSLMGYFRAGWSILFGMGGAILGVIFPVKVDALMRKVFQFTFRQDKVLQIVLGAVALILAIFIPFIVFLALGVIGGKVMHQMAMDSSMMR